MALADSHYKKITEHDVQEHGVAWRVLRICAVAGVFLVALVVSLVYWYRHSSIANGGDDSPMVSSPGSGVFLHITDVHLDPLYDASVGRHCFCNQYARQEAYCNKTRSCSASLCSGSGTGNPFGQRGCDAPAQLLHTTLKAAAAVAPEGGYDWVLVTGDYSRHYTDRLSDGSHKVLVQDIIRQVNDAVELHLPSTVVHHHVAAFSLGNNDFRSDYDNGEVRGPENKWFHAIEFLFPSTTKARVRGIGPTLPGSPWDAYATFDRGGYFLRQVSSSLYVISLNTVVYSTHRQWNRTVPDDPFGQFQWLETILSHFQQVRHDGARDIKALVVGHIPPGIDHFHFTQQWHDQYIETYTRIIMSYADVISGQIYAHQHVNSFRLMSSNVTLPIYLASAVTPVFENNPCFRLWKYRGSELLDFSIFAAELENAPQSSLVFTERSAARRAYGLESLVGDEWRRKVADAMVHNGILWRQYSDDTYVRMDRVEDSSHEIRVKQTCAVTHLRTSDYSHCVASHLGQAN